MKVKINGTIKSKVDYNNTPINWNEVHNVIMDANRIMLTTHENPDGDGLGSECGLYYHLKEIGKDVRIINYSPLPDDYNFLNMDNIFETFDINKHKSWMENVDLIIIFDVGDYSRIRTIIDMINLFELNTMNIDHHPHPENHLFVHNIVDLSAAATGCMVYDYLKIARNEPIIKNSLIGIYTAVMTDTGCFRYSNTDNKCHQIAIESLKIGIETHKIYRDIYENSTKARMKLMGGILSNINYELNGILAWFIITQDMMEQANASNADVEGFSDIVRSIRGVEVALMIFEQSSSSCRLNFRSKGKYKVNDIAKSLNGGGHAFAAGAMIQGPLNDVKDKVINTSIDFLQNKMVIS